ncbi:uncharacterized protein DSM5745_02977 [Aspergillus mulundensis]|uniref:Uncharacterized protein n=1 Tax=Aspergillus mulundensis TaxID=1810919 RepID=A0A3D8SJ13_9EURO|nr:hypothetical protein DSM5745_02977 [Aspergillus mulundensis]RDW86335.1 hypothetical protein DSM5745_02977 [Aspergillus mulundensis]
MFAALSPMQSIPNNPSNYPWTPARSSPLSPRSNSSAAMFKTTTPAPQPQFQSAPFFTFTPSPSPAQNKFEATSPSRTPHVNATATSPTPTTSSYATRYKNTISNPLLSHSSKRAYTSSTSPRARSVRRNAFLNRVKQARDDGRVEARAEQLAYMEDIAEQKEWREAMKRRAEEIQTRYGLDIEEGDEDLDADLVDEAEIQALDEYIEQERAMEMALLEGVEGNSTVGSAGHQPNGTGQRRNDKGSSFSDDEYDDIFMDLVDHGPSEDMDMSD